jgi:hypothetical protein
MYVSSLLLGREMWTRPCRTIEYLCSGLAEGFDYNEVKEETLD